jgi:uncharacterized protein YuzE
VEKVMKLNVHYDKEADILYLSREGGSGSRGHGRLKM